MYLEERLTFAQIGARLNWSEWAIGRVMKNRGVELRRRGEVVNHPAELTQDALDTTVELYQSGMSLAAVARELGVAQETVRYRLKRAGVPRRPRPTANSLRHAREISTRSRAAMSARQASIVGLLERNGPMMTIEIAERLGITARMTRASAFELRRVGLVNCRRIKGRGRMYEWKRSSLPLQDVLARALSPGAGGKPSEEDSLPIGPLRDWVERLIASEERKALFSVVARLDESDGDGTGDMPIASAVGRRLGLTDRRLWALRNEQSVISISTADRILTTSGLGVRLEDLWPHLADDMEVAA